MATLVDRITRRFYNRFKTERTLFTHSISGIPIDTEREEYASFLLNRLMFLYFIQRRGFLGGDTHYLSNHLRNIRESQGHDAFYCRFLLRLFHEGLAAHARLPELGALLGNVPYLGGNLFGLHTLERSNPTIQIPDMAFEQFFAFLDTYEWYLDDRQPASELEINPDVLGYVFEKHINQQHMGAYYTRDDVTVYVASNTILPYLFDAVEQFCPGVFRVGGGAWHLLRERSQCYIPMTIRNTKQSSNEREYRARPAHYSALCNKLIAGELHCVDDLVTYNLDLGRFAQDVIRECEEPGFLEVFYECLTKITILDPTCGSGAFLLAALRVLARLYEACIERMARREDGRPLGSPLLYTENAADMTVYSRGDPKGRPSPRIIYKSIITNNLYGVDIMDEAVQICKLRLYLALLSQIERVEDIEPLPDIDHHIRTGNALVGDVRPTDPVTSESWHTNHQPFHWYIEFDQIMSNGGFDVIIGNPPYVEYDDKNFPYTLRHFETRSCSNLYTCVVERSHHLLSQQGRHGMILPLAAFATRNMIPFMERFRRWFPCTWLSFYHFRPSMLFSSGKVASIPTAIYLAKHYGKAARFSTHIAKWTAEQRDRLFPSLIYCQVTAPGDPDNRHYYPKFGNPIENQIMEKVMQHERVGNYLARTPNQNTMYYRSAGGLYWKVFVNFVWPYHTTSNKQCSFQQRYDRDVFVALFNSSLFWWYYTVTFDTFNLKDYMLFGFRFSYPDCEAVIEALRAHCSQLMIDYMKNARHLKRGRTSSYTIYARKSKHILDEIDRVLAQHYGFTVEELEFILNYDIKYRMGQENGEES